jgi:hypothetical protein
MIRRAILIEAANIKGSGHIPGAVADVRNYQQYLTSKVGGFWYSSELVVLSKPSRARVLSEIAKAEKEAEYLFLSFSGHGYMKRPSANAFPVRTEKERTMLCINDTEELSLGEINPRIKNVVIADSCRGLEKLEEAEEMLKAATNRMMTFNERMARALFDSAVTAAEPGQILAYSCSVNEAAGEDKNRGGYFSAAMMECGMSIAKSGNQRAITTEEVFACAFREVKKLAALQNPEYSPGRRMRHFPFAVKG